jgi:5-(aminomethyl)-3-furanmethanol phosphate kinase
MDAVVKVGGRLAEQPDALRTLCLELGRQAQLRSLVVVPGGGVFADTVRGFDQTYGLPAEVSHRIAILAMDQYGLALTHLIPNAAACDALDKARKLTATKRAAIFLPSKLLLRRDPFEASWEVTSDSIAAYIATKLNAGKLVLVTDVDGVFTQDPKTGSGAELLREVSAHSLAQRTERTSVDKHLPRFLLQNPLDTYVVNGLYPERIGKILAGEPTTCTRITSSNRS